MYGKIIWQLKYDPANMFAYHASDFICKLYCITCTCCDKTEPKTPMNVCAESPWEGREGKAMGTKENHEVMDLEEGCLSLVFEIDLRRPRRHDKNFLLLFWDDKNADGVCVAAASSPAGNDDDQRSDRKQFVLVSHLRHIAIYSTSICSFCTV